MGDDWFDHLMNACLAVLMVVMTLWIFGGTVLFFIWAITN